MGKTIRSLELEDLEDTVLYDVFYESGTMLGGSLLRREREARMNGNDMLARQLRHERYALNQERETIAADDRSGQIAAKTKWDMRREELHDAML